MKVELDLPDWVDERHIRIFAGIEMVAMKWSHENFWKVKDDRCNMCGKCCTGLKDDDILCPVVDGECIYLSQGHNGERLCSIPLYRPRNCQEDPQRLIKTGECSITYKVLPV
jgi:hypothetical protein